MCAGDSDSSEDLRSLEGEQGALSKGFGLRGLSRWLESSRRSEPAFEPQPSYEPSYAPPQPAAPSYDFPRAAAPAAAPAFAPDPASERNDEVMDARRDALTQAFNPSHPVQRRNELCGRDDKLAALFEAILNQKKHAIVHGARGSGKTSLVRVFGDYADQRNVVVIYMACEAESSFGDLMRHYVRYVPTTSMAMDAVDAFEAGVDALDETSRPRQFVELLTSITNCQIIFILDEFDRVTDRHVQSEVATFMKLLSDAAVPVQLLIVGIARSVADIIDCHPSLRRHLTAIAIGRISREDLGLLIDQGAARSGIGFDPAARDLIIRTACGSPYHARLFCHHAGMVAIERGASVVDIGAGLAGLSDALEEWGRLNEADSLLFRRLTETAPAMRRRLADIARVAAIGDGFTRGSVADTSEEDLHLTGALEGALVSDVRDISRRIFRDSLAPQFLLVEIELANAREMAPRVAPPPPAAEAAGFMASYGAPAWLGANAPQPQQYAPPPPPMMAPQPQPAAAQPQPQPAEPAPMPSWFQPQPAPQEPPAAHGYPPQWGPPGYQPPYPHGGYAPYGYPQAAPHGWAPHGYPQGYAPAYHQPAWFNPGYGQQPPADHGAPQPGWGYHDRPAPAPAAPQPGWNQQWPGDPRGGYPAAPQRAERSE